MINNYTENEYGNHDIFIQKDFKSILHLSIQPPHHHHHPPPHFRYKKWYLGLS